MSWFQALLASGTGFNPGGGIDYYVATAGTGDGRSAATPMSLTDFLLVPQSEFDRVFFKRGDTFVFPEYDITVDNLTFGVYGSGSNPIFYGSDATSTFTSETGGYYSMPLATAPLWVVNPAGEMARQGESDWIPVTSGITDTRGFDDATLDAFHAVESLVGCKARFKEFNFRMSYEYTVLAYDGNGVLTFDAVVVGALDDYPMKLYGQKQFATLEGDWWYDDANNELWIKTASDPTGLGWRVVTENRAFFVNAASGITVSGIEFTQYYRAAVESYQADNLNISTINIHDVRTNGLWLYGNCDGITVDDYTIDRCGMNGILIGAIQTASFTNGVITEMGRQDNICWPIDTDFRKTGGDAFAISDESGETNKLPGNITISNFLYSELGGHGISTYGNDWIISNGEIKNYALAFDDVGGVHTFYTNSFGTGTSTGTISNVIVHDGIGSSEGIANYTIPDVAAGFYLDNGSHQWTLNDCSAYNNSVAGVYANWNTEETTINGGFFANNGTDDIGAQIVFVEKPNSTDSPNYLHNYKNVIDGALVIPGAQDQRAILTLSFGTGADASYNPFTTGSCDNNRYARIYSTVGVSLFGHGVDNIIGTITGVSFAGWQTRNSCDASSTSMTSYIDYTNAVNQLREVQVFVNPTASSSNEAVGVEFQDEDSADISSPMSIPAWSARIALRKSTNYYLSDSFNGSPGTTIAGRNPKIGAIPTILAGTHTIVSVNNLGSTVNGHVRWDLGSPDFVFEVSMKVSNLSDAFLMNFRAADATTSATHRVVFTATATTMTLAQNNDSASSDTLQTVAFVPVINTLYKWKFIFNGGSIILYRDDVEVMNTTTAVVTGNYSGIFATTLKTSEYITAYKL